MSTTEPRRRRRRTTASMDPKRVVAYLRVSTEEQAESGLGLAAQRTAIEDWARQSGYTIVDWCVDEGVSAKNLDREQFQRALQLIAEHKAAGLVVSKLDRLSRSMLDFCSLTAQATSEKWNIISLDVNLDLSTPSGELIAGILVLFAQWERKIIGQRTRDGLAEKRAAGVRLGAEVKVTDDTLRLVAETFLDYGRSYTRTAALLNEDAVPTATGKGRWHPDSVRKMLLAGHGQEMLDTVLSERLAA